MGVHISEGERPREAGKDWEGIKKAGEKRTILSPDEDLLKNRRFSFSDLHLSTLKRKSTHEVSRRFPVQLYVTLDNA